MASFVFNEAALQLQGGTITWASDTIKVRLVANSVTPNKDDTSMTGYTAIGTDQTLGSKTKTKDATNDRIVYDGADVSYTAVTSVSTIGWIIVYKFVTNDAGSTPIVCIDVTDTPTNGGDISVPWAATGIFYSQE